MGLAATPVDRPRLRGWSHLVVGAPAAVVCTAILVVLGNRGIPVRIGLLIYGLASIELFVVSGLYHVVRWSPPIRARLRRLDHSNIFLLVAGTYTPVCIALLDDPWRWAIGGTAWGIAVVGIAVTWTRLAIPRGVLAGCYLAQGWVAIVAVPRIGAATGSAGLVEIGVAGLLYTLGALAYAFRRPNPWPRVFGYHEVFHVLVIAANALFFVFMLHKVVHQ